MTENEKTAVVVPKEVEGASFTVAYPSASSSPLVVGHFVAAKGGLVSAQSWQGTRQEFAKAFVGVSQCDYDPTKKHLYSSYVFGKKGGTWLIECVGDCPKETPLGPVVVDGKLDSMRLEACADNEAIAYATGERNRVILKG